MLGFIKTIPWALFWLVLKIIVAVIQVVLLILELLGWIYRVDKEHAGGVLPVILSKAQAKLSGKP